MAYILSALKIILALLLIIKFDLGDCQTCPKATTGTKSCFLKEQDSLQLALVYDRTNSYEEFGKSFQKFILPELLKELSQFKKLELALTVFADYSQYQNPKPIKRSEPEPLAAAAIYPDNTTGCYEKLLSFTEEKKAVSDALGKLTYITSGGSGESSKTAILFTAADLGLNWNKQADCNPLAPQLLKVMVLLTEETTTEELQGEDNSKRKKALGDGKDTCLSSSIPTNDTVKKVLEEKNIKLVAVLNEVETRPNIKQTWIKYFESFGIDTAKAPKQEVLRKNADEEKDANMVAKEIVAAIDVALGGECGFGDASFGVPYNTLGY